jgi:hypothetical protein
MRGRNLHTAMRRTSLALTIAVTALATSGCQLDGGLAQARRNFALTPQWADYARVVVHSRNGRVELAVAPGAEFQIQGQTRVRGETQEQANANLDQLTVVAEPDAGDPGTFLVELRVPATLNQNSPAADFVIRVPKPCTADLHTSNGSIRAAGLKGPLVLGSSNGSITAEDVAGAVQAESSNGQITLDKVDGAVQAQSSNGSVTAKSITGDVSATTSNGRISVEKVSGKCVLRTSNGLIEVVGTTGDITARTCNAAIRVDGSPDATGVVVLETSNGSINATLPAQMNAAVELATSNGHIDAAFGDIPMKVREISKTRVDAGMNGGGPGRIKADTSNGSITLRFR